MRNAILAIIVFGLVGIPQLVGGQEFRAPILGVDGGRFVLGQISMARSDQYLLDTETGALWVLGTDKNGDRLLQAVQFVGSAPSASPLPRWKRRLDSLNADRGKP